MRCIYIRITNSNAARVIEASAKSKCVWVELQHAWPLDPICYVSYIGKCMPMDLLQPLANIFVCHTRKIKGRPLLVSPFFLVISKYLDSVQGCRVRNGRAHELDRFRLKIQRIDEETIDNGF